eukprot:jgi/Tetstr1/454129/TSEL_041048.t1
MGPHETHTFLVMVLSMCNNFLPPILRALRGASATLQTIQRASAGIGAVGDLCATVDHAVWQLDTLNRVVQRYYAAHMPPSEAMDGTEPLARAIAEANVISFNVYPLVEAFSTPDAVDGAPSWEALRQSADYLVFIRAGEHGNWLCRVVGEDDGARVQLRRLRSGEPVSIPPRLRLRWAGRNIEVTLRTGVKSYAAYFVLDPRPARAVAAGDAASARRDALRRASWTDDAIDRYVKYHGELPDAAW